MRERLNMNAACARRQRADQTEQYQLKPSTTSNVHIQSVYLAASEAIVACGRFVFFLFFRVLFKMLNVYARNEIVC